MCFLSVNAIASKKATSGIEIGKGVWFFIFRVFFGEFIDDITKLDSFYR